MDHQQTSFSFKRSKPWRRSRSSDRSGQNGGFSNSHSRSHSSGRPPETRRGQGAFGGGRPFGNSGNSGSFIARGGNFVPRRNNRINRFQGANIPLEKLVNKALPAADAIPYVPQHTFSDFPVDKRLKSNIIAKGYSNPTPIQDQAIPHVLAGTDVVGIANTGTGKTAAFLVPLIHATLAGSHKQTLIIVPTRELATQISQEFKSLAAGLGLRSATLIGGGTISAQISDLRRGFPHVIIGTPGRLKDLMDRKVLDIGGVTALVLDEADRMLDMGFINDIKFLVGRMGARTQTLFFSATLSKDIEQLISSFLRDPVSIMLKKRETSANVDQDVIRVGDPARKLEVLHELLVQSEFTKVLVFGRTKHGVEKLSNVLASRGFKVDAIHGNKTHNRRARALKLFKESHIQILVATDVAARGLDIDSISHVINYDMPTTYEDYVHRIGRTGRGEKRGKALTFI